MGPDWRLTMRRMMLAGAVVALMMWAENLRQERARTGAVFGAQAVSDREIDWNEASTLVYRKGNELDRGLKELLETDEWRRDDPKLRGFFFKNQDEFHSSLRRLIGDADVGDKPRDWLDLLDEPGDRDLFVKGRRYKPKKEVKEIDLIEALKATARQRNFFSSAREPRIRIDSITFTQDLDRALIHCGINQVAMTGFSWNFVFRKVGRQWELRSAREAGRA
jgi:hypothetical protein